MPNSGAVWRDWEANGRGGKYYAEKFGVFDGVL